MKKEAMNLKEKLRRVYRMVWREEIEGKCNYSQKNSKRKKMVIEQSLITCSFFFNIVIAKFYHPYSM